MPEMISLSDFAGGSEITSYNLESNQGSGSVFYEIIGESLEQLERVITVTTTPGETYSFRYRIKNILGFSEEYSPEAEVKSAKAPLSPTDVVTSISGKNVLIEWTSSDDNYDTVTRFEIEIESKEGEWL
jgi:predicted GTPase